MTSTWLNPDPVSTSLFVLINGLVLGAVFFAIYRSWPHGSQDRFAKTARFAYIYWAWLAVPSVMALSGFAEAEPFPRLPIFFALVNIVALGIGFSPWGKQLALATPIKELVLFQAFRLPLELILHHWASTGTIPVSMTWNGANFDVVTGILALVLGPFAAKKLWIGWMFNIIGLALLINVIRVALMSLPLPFAWDVEPKLQVAFHFPFVLIAPVCVGWALTGHVVLTRALLAKSR